MTVRLEVTGPDGQVVLVVAGGEVRLLEPREVGTVVPALRGDPSGCRVAVDGHVLRRRGRAGRVRRGLVVVGAAPVAADVTVRDHLAAIVGRAAAVDLLAGTPLLSGRDHDPAGVLSGGERRVLAWLRAVALGPAVVLLDGAGEGLDADTLRWAAGQVADWSRAGVAVVVRAGRPEERAWARGSASPASPRH